MGYKFYHQCVECKGRAYQTAVVGDTAQHVRVRHLPWCVWFAEIYRKFPRLIDMRTPEIP